MRQYYLVLLVALLAACTQPVVRDSVPSKPATPAPKVEKPLDDNPYTNSYVARELHGVKLQPGAAKPQLFRGVNETDDYQRMLNDGYEMLGYSRFELDDVPPSRAEAQALKVQAEAVVIYTQTVATPTAAMRMKQIKEQQNTQQSTQKSSQPTQMYSYFATYWAKLQPPVLGVHVMQRLEKDTEPGLTVLAVITGSPAAQADVVTGDILLSLNGKKLDSPQGLQALSAQNAGQEVELVLKRVNVEKHYQVKLNAAP